MRKESSNQFTEGLVCDLNPINTPNTVLTDALNATIITYDGNEYSLQNDRGNYPLENCKLKPNYIPVGLKEYGDILYIVSYNPLNEHVEIGTYPSPMEVVGNSDEQPELEIESIIGKITEPTDYSDLVERCETKVWTSNNEEDTKLYPGDKYKIKEEDDSKYKYETLEYFIIDENRQKYDISDLVEKDNEWHPIAWQVPGWLATQYRIATFDDFIMSVRSMTIPKLGEGTVNGNLRLNFQLRISDHLFLPNQDNDVKSDLYIEIKFGEKDKPDFKELISLEKADFIEWYEDSKILWIDWTKHLKGLSFGDTITFHATPIVKIAGKVITYDSFTESYSIHLNSIGSYSDFNIGDEIWKFYIDKDDLNNLYLEYNITGPNVTKTDVNLYYQILDLEYNTLKSWTIVEDYTGITNQGVGKLEFGDTFEKESIYIIEFAFYKPLLNDYSELKEVTSIKKLVIASQIFSDFVGEYNNFNDIGFDDWVVKYKDSVKVQTCTANYNRGENNNGIDSSNFKIENKQLTIDNKPFKLSGLNDLWSANPSDNKGVFNTTDTSALLNRKEELFIGKQYENVTVRIDCEATTLNGPLWKGTPDVSVEISSALKSQITKYNREKFDGKQTYTEIISTILGETISAEYIIDRDCKIVKGIEKLDNVPIIHLHVNTRSTYSNQTNEATLYDCGTWPNNILKSQKKRVYLEDGGEFITKDNAISSEIRNILSDNQMALLVVTMCYSEGGDDGFGLYHENCEWWTDDTDRKAYAFSYLVFRKTDLYKGKTVVIPIKGNGIWETYVGEVDDSPQDLLDNIIEREKDYLAKFCESIIICSSNNAVENANLLKIQLGEELKSPVCSLKLYTPGFNFWNIGGKNILNYSVREGLINELGQNVCGELLRGSITTIPSIEFYNKTVDNKEESENDFTNLKRHVDRINGLVNYVDVSDIISILDSKNTKGVYCPGSCPRDVINLLHNNYRNSNNSKLSADGTLADAYVWLVDDKDGIVFANVNTTVTAQF